MHYYCQGCHSGKNWRLFSINCIYSGALYLVFHFITSVPFVSLAFCAEKRHKGALYVLPYFRLSLPSASLLHGERQNYPKWKLDLPPKCYSEFHDHHMRSSSVAFKGCFFGFFILEEITCSGPDNLIYCALDILLQLQKAKDWTLCGYNDLLNYDQVLLSWEPHWVVIFVSKDS